MPFVDIDSLEVREPRPGWRGRFLNTAHMTLAYYEFDKDSWIHEHAHESEEVWNVVEGTLEITLDGETRTVSGWSAVSVASNVPHAVTALSDGRAIVVDYPRRDTIGGITIGS